MLCSRHLCLLLVILTGPIAHGTTFTSAEGMAAHVLTEYVERYAEANAGRLPKSWTDLRPVIGESTSLLKHAETELRYAILANPVPLLPPLEGLAIVINRSDIYDITYGNSLFGAQSLRGPGRYLCYRDRDGDFRRSWVKSDYVIKVFQAAGMALPEPDGLPERPAVQRHRNIMLGWKIFFGAMVALTAWRVWRRHLFWRIALRRRRFPNLPP